jgi:hypothetical protein
MDSQQGQARKLFWEGLVVVVSILIAFGVDASWDAAELRRDVRLDLENVARELQMNRDRVDFHIDMVTRIHAALGYLDGALATSDMPQILVPDTVAWLAALSPTLDASLGAIDALIASGRIAAIEEPELATRLAGLRDVVDDAREEQVYNQRIIDQHLIPYLGDAERGTGHLSSFWSYERVPGRALSYKGDVAYPNNSVTRGAAARMQGNAFVIVNELQGLVAELDAIEALLEGVR